MPEVTLATLNIFNNPYGRWADREPLIASQLAELAPDVCALQEVDRAGERAAAVVARANDALGDKRYALHLMPNPSATSIKSLAIASRFRLTNHERLDLEENDIAFRVNVQFGGTADPGATFDLVTTHFLYRPSREGGEIRLRQARRLLEWLEPSRDRPTVLMGDFNALPTGATVAALKEEFRSTHEVAHGAEPETTQPTPFVYSLDAPKAFGVPELPPDRKHTVDYIFVRGDAEVRDARVAFDRSAADDAILYPSDHYGLVAKLRLPD